MAGYLAGNVDEWIYIDIADQHPDNNVSRRKMKTENLEKMKQVIKDELGVSDELAELGANVALDAIRKSLIMIADRLFTEGKKEHESTT